MASNPTAGGSGRFLPRDPRVEEPYLFSPKMALRVAILAAIALAVFAVLFLRLWSLQILSGTKYENAALNNQLRTVRREAPRGTIVDRAGPRARHERRRDCGRGVAGRPAEARSLRGDEAARPGRPRPAPQVLAQLEQRKNDPLTPVTVQVSVHKPQLDYLAEHRREFPGVHTRLTYLRKYNTQALLAHVLGYVGEISPDQLKKQRKDGYEAGDEVGQTGVERTYDTYLRGQPEIDEVHVNSLGRPVPGRSRSSVRSASRASACS